MTLVRKYNIKYIFYWIVHKNYLFIIYKLLCSNFSIYVNELYIYIFKFYIIMKNELHNYWLIQHTSPYTTESFNSPLHTQL